MSAAKPTSLQNEYDGEQCVVLPSNYLTSAQAVAEIYETELSSARSHYRIELFDRPGYFKAGLLTVMLWGMSGIWTVCL